MEAPVAYDNLMIDNLKRCERYFFHRHIEHLSPIGDNFDTDFKAQFGVAWHFAMDKWFGGEGADEMDKAFLDHWLPFEGMDSKEIRTAKNGLSMLEKYRKKYPLENDPFKVADKEHIEVGFTLELGKYLYCGRIDKVAKWEFGFSGNIVIDHKTSGAKGFLILKPNAAFDGYSWAASQVLKESVVGVLVDQVYMYKTKTDFIRELTERKPIEIEEWKHETIMRIDSIQRYLEYGFWPRSDKSCRAFGRDCEYKILCTCIDKDMISSIKEAGFEEKIWKPYQEEEEGDE